jgi:hypothetical protein
VTLRATTGCPCADADRFVVVEESADARWLASADVIVARPRPTVYTAQEAAERLGRLPGCAFVLVPIADNGIVVGGRAGSVAIAERGLCGICLYPWLVNGGRLADLTVPKPRPAAS